MFMWQYWTGKVKTAITALCHSWALFRLNVAIKIKVAACKMLPLHMYDRKWHRQDCTCATWSESSVSNRIFLDPGLMICLHQIKQMHEPSDWFYALTPQEWICCDTGPFIWTAVEISLRFLMYVYEDWILAWEVTLSKTLLSPLTTLVYSKREEFLSFFWADHFSN